jgi:hypothetical protein
MATTDQQPKPRKRRRWIRVITIVVAIVAAATLAGKFWLRDKYPYGVTHACSKILGLGLRMYANDHQNWFPYGGATPEESLSLVCSNGDPYSVKGLLCGKHLSRSLVEATMANNSVLSPATCGWHYVEGLREDDPQTLAIAWDKVVGLDHNGRFHKHLQCEVVMLDGSAQQIPKAAWPKFCAQQRELIAKVVAERTTNDPAIRWSDEAALGPNKFPAPAISKTK